MWNNIKHLSKFVIFDVIIPVICVILIFIGLAYTVDFTIDKLSNKNTKQVFMFDDLKYGYDKIGNCYAYYGSSPYHYFTSIPCESIDMMNKKKIENELNFEKAIEEMRRKDSGLY